MTDATAEAFEFKAEIRQLLNILVHSLYSDREIFLRELVSNASDALNRLRIEQLTNPDVLDPSAELRIDITTDEEAGILTIRDTGIGMSREELMQNLGTIAHSGAAQFLAALQQRDQGMDVIGQFGVGFYSVFMVADTVEVTSRSHRSEDSAWTWRSTGDNNYELRPADKADRGTEIRIHLKDDAQDSAKEFARGYRIEQIIRAHSDFVAFPIYVNGGEKPVNQRTALWREPAAKISDEDANNFYRQLTLEFEPPLLRTHVRTDVPVQIYALLFVPGSSQRGPLSARQEDGLKLYTRKVLIQDYTTDLLPKYFRFVHGVVDSEDIPLNVSREMVQNTPVMARIKKALTGRLIDDLKKLAADDAEKYAAFWQQFGYFIKEGIATDNEYRDRLMSLWRVKTSTSAGEWTDLAGYIERMDAQQSEIYYLLGDDPKSIGNSPHLDSFRQRGLEVIYLTDPIDSFVVTAVSEFEGKALRNAASADLTLPETEQSAAADDTAPALEGDSLAGLVARFKAVLGELVVDVRASDRLSSSPVRLVEAEGAMGQEMQRVYRLIEQNYEVPKKVLEINPRHALLTQIAGWGADDPRAPLLIEQLFESALLLEGLHPNPAGMVTRIQQLMEKAAGL